MYRKHVGQSFTLSPSLNRYRLFLYRVVGMGQLWESRFECPKGLTIFDVVERHFLCLPKTISFIIIFRYRLGNYRVRAYVRVHPIVHRTIACYMFCLMFSSAIRHRKQNYIGNGQFDFKSNNFIRVYVIDRFELDTMKIH